MAASHATQRNTIHHSWSRPDDTNVDSRADEADSDWHVVGMAPIPLPSLLESRHALESLTKRLPSPSPSASTTIESHQLRTRALHLLNTLLRRQGNPNIVPTTYGSLNSGPAPGTVVGIVLGSVGGFLLLLWLIYTCLNFGNWGSSSSYTESIVVRDRRKSHHGSQRSRRVSETVEVRRERSPIRVVRDEPRVERVVVEEERRDRSRGSDEVVVIEEHSPPRRSKSKRERRDEERRESGFRTVDPLAYGGVVGGRKSSRR